MTKEEKTWGEDSEINYYQYDANGNQISKLSETIGPKSAPAAEIGLYLLGEGSSNSSTEMRTYDVFNRLKSEFSGFGAAEYTYQPDNLRLSKTVNGDKTTHIWDGQDIVAEMDDAGVMTAGYLRGGGGRLISIIGASTNYYLFNGHGDVTGYTDASGNLVKAYKYDAFGSEIDRVVSDANPFRYSGEYYDLETNTYYLRARNYDPRTSRMLSPDPLFSMGYNPNDPNGLNIYNIMQSTNLYAYCINNPIRFIDPSGNVIQLSGTAAEMAQILSTMQELTDYTLAIDKNGVVYVSTFAGKDNIKFASGNELLTRMIDSSQTCTIQIRTGQGNGGQAADMANAINKGKGSDYTVFFDPTADPDIMTVDPATGNVSGAKRPNYVGLAHELIHSDRAMRGVGIDRSTMGDYKYQSSRVEKYFIFKSWSWWSPVYTTQNVRREELATVGLKYANKGDITENMIRAEHGLNLRGAY